MTTEETIEALAQFEAWREETLLAGPDASLTAYIRVLEAAEPDPRIAEVHGFAVHLLDNFKDVADSELRDYLQAIAKLTDTIAHADVEEFTF